MSSNFRPIIVSLPLTLALGAMVIAQPQDQSIVDTTHNLSTSGPGPFKATAESRICIFCHTPHRARSVAPLWNREDSRETYLSYSSTTFGGTTGQPNGSSKMCLSCHDGSIALGSVLSLGSEIDMAPGHRTLDTGAAFLGSNLADDHPVSFNYAASDGGQGVEYLSPSTILPPVHLDQNGFLQCTSCHDPHNNAFGDFLLATDRFSALCTSCHVPLGWMATSHSTSPATWTGSGQDPWATAKYATVTENACANCHRPHSAEQPERLLTSTVEESICLVCHTGTVASKDMSSDLAKPYGHSPADTLGVHDPTENPLVMNRHAECQDCHNSHAAYAGGAAAPGVPGPLVGISGLDSGGQQVDRITFGYELCYKCHADNHGLTAYVPRQHEQMNVRMEFDPANPSFHPIEAPGANPDVPSLLPPWTTASIMTCGDCHQSDSSPDFGGTGPAGPHGSVYQPLLALNYSRVDNSPESPQAYALCYKCHSRSSILDDDSFDKHRKHIVKEDTPCSACHDAHGVSFTQGTALGNTSLINFDLSIVSPLPDTGELFFRDLGFRQGTCTLLCHGEEHDDEDY